MFLPVTRPGDLNKQDRCWQAPTRIHCMHSPRWIRQSQWSEDTSYISSSLLSANLCHDMPHSIIMTAHPCPYVSAACLPCLLALSTVCLEEQVSQRLSCWSSLCRQTPHPSPWSRFSPTRSTWSASIRCSLETLHPRPSSTPAHVSPPVGAVIWWRKCF